MDLLNNLRNNPSTRAMSAEGKKRLDRLIPQILLHASRSDNSEQVLDRIIDILLMLKAGGYKLCDTQFVTAHLRQFGTVELSREEFHRMLEGALDVEADFLRLPRTASGEKVLAILESAAPRI